MKTIKKIPTLLLVSPRKLRAVIDLVRPLTPANALEKLKFTNSRSARFVYRFLKNAVAAAKNNYQWTTESLVFKQFVANEGLKIKRMDKAHGSRFARGIKTKRHSRLNLILSGKIASQTK
jgi:large subunit ribosomal protein L22